MSQLQREARRARKAEQERTLVQEHLDAKKKELFDRFCDPEGDWDLETLKHEVSAVSSLENFLQGLIDTGVLVFNSQENIDD
jgi:hypothetical protein